jgi:hypothetical protein
MEKDKKWKCSFNPYIINKNETNQNQGKGFKSIELTIDEIIEGISDYGWAMSYQYSNNIRNEGNFEQTEFTQVDIDFVRSLSDVINDPLVQNHAAFVYTTASHTPETPRLRVFFALPRIIDESNEIIALNKSLTRRLGGDIKATSAAQIFYGSKGCHVTEINQVLDLELLEELIKDDIHQNDPESSIHQNKTSNRSLLEFDKGIIVKLPNGQQVPVSSLHKKTTIYCPFHHDEKPSAFVGTSKGNWFIFCNSSNCGKTRWASGHHPSDYLFYDFEETIKNLDDRAIDANLKFKEIEYPLPIPLDRTLKNNSVTLSSTQHIQIDSISEGITFIKSHKGSGKTTAISKKLINLIFVQHGTLEEFEEKYDADEPVQIHTSEKILLIGHRQALIKDLCNKFSLNCYLDDDKHFRGENYYRKKRYGVCLDSLWKIKGEEYDTVVIDEVEQVLCHFLSETIGSNGEYIFKIFQQIIKKAKRVIVIDADLGWITFNTLTAIRNYQELDQQNSHIYLNTWQPPKRELFLYDSDKHLISDLFESIELGKKIFITSNSKNMVTDLHHAIENNFQKKIKTLLITSENSKNKDIQYFISNIKDEIQKYDVVLSSPSLGTGIDITFDNNDSKIDCVYGFFKNQINSHFEIDQQIARVRNPKELKVWISNSRFFFETDFNVIRQEKFINNASANLYSNVEVIESDEYFKPENLFITMASMITSQQRASKNSLKANFIRYKVRQNYQITSIQNDEISSKIGKHLSKLGKSISSANHINGLLNAPIFNRNQLNEINENLESGNDVSRNDLYSFYRTKTELFYRQKISLELVDFDNLGKSRTKIRRYQVLTDPEIVYLSKRINLPDNKKVRLLKEYSIKDFNQGCRLLDEIFKTTPIYKNHQFLNDVTFCSDDLLKFITFVSNKKIKGFQENHFGITVRTDITSKPIQHLNSLLGLVGLKVTSTSTKRNKGEGKTYFYKISTEYQSKIEAILARQKEVKEWDFINETYGFDPNDFDWEQWEYSKKGRNIL